MAFQFEEDLIEEETGFSFEEEEPLFQNALSSTETIIEEPKEEERDFGGLLSQISSLWSSVFRKTWKEERAQLWEEVGEAFSGVGQKTADAAWEAKDKFIRGASSFKQSTQALNAAWAKNLNKAIHKTWLISDETFTRIDNKFWGEQTSTMDLLNLSRQKAWISAFQLTGWIIETAFSPISWVLGQAVEELGEAEAWLREDKTPKSINSIVNFLDFTEKSVWEDILDTAGYTTADYTAQEMRDVWAWAWDLLEGLWALKWLKTINNKTKTDKKLDSSIKEGDIESAAEAIITKPTEPDINLKQDIISLSEDNNLTLNWYNEVATKLWINTDNIDKLIKRAADADDSLAFPLYNKSKSTKTSNAEIEKLLKEADTSTKAKKKEAIKNIASDTWTSRKSVNEIVERISFKSLSSPKKDLAQLASLNGSKNTLARGKTETWYDSTLSSAKSEVVVRLEDDWILKRKEEGDSLYSFALTAKGKKILNEEGLKELSPTILNKDSYDGIYTRNSFEIKADKFDKLSAEAIKKDINFWPREFSRLKELAFRNEFSKGSKILNDDILSTVDTLNNRYNLKLDDKLKELVDSEGNIKTDVLASIMKDINEFAKKDFANIKNIKKQASELMDSFNIEKKIENQPLSIDKSSLTKVFHGSDLEIENFRSSRDLKAELWDDFDTSNIWWASDFVYFTADRQVARNFGFARTKVSLKWIPTINEWFIDGEVLDLSKNAINLTDSDVATIKKIIVDMWGDWIIRVTKWREEKVIAALKSFVKNKGNDKNLNIDFNDIEKTKTLLKSLEKNWISGFEFFDLDTAWRKIKAFAVSPNKVFTKKQVDAIPDFSLERGLKEVLSMKNAFRNARKNAKTKKDLEKAYILWENYRLKKLQVESKVDKTNATKEFFLDEVKELARDTAYKWDVSEIFKKLNVKGFFEEADAVSKAQKIIAEAQAEGLFKEIGSRVKGLWESSKDIQILGGTDNLLNNFLKGNASLDNLYELLLRMDEIKATNTKELNWERATNVALAQTDLEQIREDWLTQLKGSEVLETAGESTFTKSVFAKVRQGFNELNFMMRILETIGTTSKKFKDIFLFEVDGKYNNVQAFKDEVVDRLLIDIDKSFSTAKERIGLGQYLMLFRKSVDEAWVVEFQWYEKLKSDRTSWLNVKRSDESLAKSPIVKPKSLAWMTDTIWQDVRKSRLWEVLEAGLTDSKYKDIQDKLKLHFDTLKSDNDAITQLYDNAIVRPVENYLPLYERGKHQATDFGGFDDPNFVNSKITDNHNQKTTKAELIYEYDIAKVASRGLMNQKYYNEMRPQFEKMKGIMYGKKINNTLYEEPHMKGDEFMENREGGLVSDMDPETQRILEVYLERVRAGWDKYSAMGNMFNRAVGYVNNQYLWFNPGTILKQPLWFFDAAGIVWTRNMQWSMRNTFNTDLVKQSLEASSTLKNRFWGQISIRDLESISTGKIGKNFAKFQKLSVEGIRVTDQFTATRVWMAAYRKFMKDNGLLQEGKDVMDFSNIEGVEFADIIMQKAMSTVNPLLLPPAYRSVFTRAVWQLMTTQLNRLGILFNDIPDIARSWDHKRAALWATGWMVSSIWDKAITAWMWYVGYQLGIYAWQGYDREYIDILIGEDSEERIMKLWEYVLWDLFWGQQVKAMFTWDDILVVWGFVSQIGKDVMKIVDADDWEERVQGFFDLAWDSFGTWVGRRAADFYQNYND